ncbi:hypothetical protein [Puia dinghuensis]|uniref:Uncharacterized protein n=1 Tax=Puia dinghuensis TaxID=1792502 RepID=A0A8J2XW44_9BACT|nr:hypothetical protein [Puia dinghuensis]GGB23507.1 hypothetical protein GCM10011511_54200 [Puia dinghuensis]
MKRKAFFPLGLLFLILTMICLRSNGQTPSKQGGKQTTDQKSDTATDKPAPKPRKPVEEMVQSPYYDAVELLYALNGYKAYPLIAGKVIPADSAGRGGSAGGAPTGKNSGPSAADDDDLPDEMAPQQYAYILIEAETGKILYGPSTNKDSLTTILKANKFGSDTREQRSVLTKILRRNTWGSEGLSDDAVWNLALQNPYFFKPNAAGPSIAGNRSPALTLNIPDMFSTGSQAISVGSIGGANPWDATSIAEGVAKLLINRVNKEFQNNFIDLLVDYLQKKHPEVGILFPQTLKALQQFQLAQYKSSYTAIQNACQTDISGLLGNVSTLTTLQWCKDMIKNHPPLVLLFASCDMIDMLRQNVALPEVLYRLGNEPYLNDAASISSYSSFIRLVTLVSNSLRDIQVRTGNKAKQGWVSQDKLFLLLQNKAYYQTFLGMVTQNAIGIRFTINGRVYDFHDILVADTARLINDWGPIYNLAQEISNEPAVAAALSTALQAKPTPQLINYITAFGSVADYIFDLTQTGVDLVYGDTANALQAHIKEIKAICMPMIGNLDSIVYAIAQQRYATALGGGVQLMNSILAAAADKKASDSVGNFIRFLNTSGQFIGAVAEAQNSQDVANALDAFALPPGSSRAQKENTITLGLNAYVNVYHSWNKQYSGTSIPTTETGISAPLGLAFSVGLCHGKGGAFTAFAGLLDVGAIFSYELTDTNSIKSTIQWGQLFAPSFSIIYDAPLFAHKKFNLPMEIGAGLQWGPRLKRVTEKANSTLPFLTERFNIFIGFDIPILHLYSYKKS